MGDGAQITRTWASDDFGVCGGPLGKSPHIARDNSKTNESKP